MLSREEMFDRPFMGEDSTGEPSHFIGGVEYAVVGFLCKLVGRYKVEGREHLRALRGKSGVVVACTHTSFLDICFLWCAVRLKQWMRPIARDTLFEKNRLTGHLMARAGAFPITRDSADRTAIKRAARMLKNKECVGIFPEGTRRGKSGLAPELHGGVALIARMGKAPIVPASVVNAEKIKVKGDWRIHFPKVYVRFGKPVEVGWFDFLPKDERLIGCSWYVMRECFALFYGTPAEEVDMAALFPNAKDYSAVFAAHPPAPAAQEAGTREEDAR